MRVFDRAPGWIAIPWASAPRWWLPRGSATLGSLTVYHPVTGRGRAGWRLARILARLGTCRLVRPGAAPPSDVQEMVAPYLPSGGSVAVMRANHPERFVALLLNATGQPTSVAKVALSEAAATALRREAVALAEFATRLQAPLTAPDVLAFEPGLLLTTAVAWRVRREPWRLPADVAAALGSLFCSTRMSQLEPVGGSHGDCAPWNLLWTGAGWTLIDWEEAKTQAPPFTDLFHFLVQAHVLLKRPRRQTILSGLSGRGWIGRALRAYGEVTELPSSAARDYLTRYLVTSLAAFAGASDELASVRARQKLLVAVHKGRK